MNLDFIFDKQQAVRISFCLVCHCLTFLSNKDGHIMQMSCGMLTILVMRIISCLITSPLVGVRSIATSVSVCLFVCLFVCLSVDMSQKPQSKF